MPSGAVAQDGPTCLSLLRDLALCPRPASRLRTSGFSGTTTEGVDWSPGSSLVRLRIQRFVSFEKRSLD
jgi:hypothetical protein